MRRERSARARTPSNSQFEEDQAGRMVPLDYGTKDRPRRRLTPTEVKAGLGIVLTIVVVLGALEVRWAVERRRAAALEAEVAGCAANLRLLGQAMLAYSSENR